MRGETVLPASPMREGPVKGLLDKVYWVVEYLSVLQPLAQSLGNCSSYKEDASLVGKRLRSQVELLRPVSGATPPGPARSTMC